MWFNNKEEDIEDLWVMNDMESINITCFDRSFLEWYRVVEFWMWEMIFFVMFFLG